MATCTSRRALAALVTDLADRGETFDARLPDDPEVRVARILDVSLDGLLVEVDGLGERLVHAVMGGTLRGCASWLALEPVEG